jgi:NitT/TauT family transport system ATP-binding protein
MNDAILTADCLSHTFPGANGGTPALDCISLAVRREEFVCVVGPSGCGKSTLLRILGGLLVPSQGVAMLDGEPTTRPRRRVGFVFQKANLMPWRTVVDNVMLPLELAGKSLDARRQAALDLIRLVGLEGFEDAYPGELSGGMEQRVTLARSLVHEPDVLLLDEPFGALDALTRERMGQELLRIWAARRKTVLMVTHSINEAILLADRVVALSPRPGRVRAEFEVPLPRPRSLKMLHNPQTGELSERIRGAIAA